MLALPEESVTTTDDAEGTGMRINEVGGVEVLPPSLAEELAWLAGYVVPEDCGSRVPAEPVVEGVSIVAIEVRTWLMV